MFAPNWPEGGAGKGKWKPLEAPSSAQSAPNIGSLLFHFLAVFRCTGLPSQWQGMMGVEASGLGKGCFPTPGWLALLQGGEGLEGRWQE